MSHLAMEQLLALRDRADHEPGLADARAHLARCAVCTEELRRLEQRVARLRALPPLRPARDQWPAVRARFVGAQRAVLLRRSAWVGLAAAAGIALGAVIRPSVAPADPVAVAAAPAWDDLDVIKARSHALEASLQAYAPEQRVLDGRTAAIADALEDRIARLDLDLQAAQLDGRDRGAEARDATLRRLWEERVGLLDALVDVRVTRASNIGL